MQLVTITFIPMAKLSADKLAKDYVTVIFY